MPVEIPTTTVNTPAAITVVASQFAFWSFALRRPHCQPSHIENFRHLVAMHRKDTWVREAFTIMGFFFSILFAQGQTSPTYVQASEHAGAWRLEGIGGEDDTLRYALVTHAASMNSRPGSNRTVHTLDLALENGFKVVKIFTPEHGFTGAYSAGQAVVGESVGGVDIPIVSLYGQHKKPSKEDLEDIDAVFFDLQDVGVRFYTYISTLTYVMESCAEYHIPLIVLDRPNPFANVVDGPVLDTAYTSFVGMHPVPVLYGLTMGEYAQMVKGESWIKHAEELELIIAPCVDYHRETVQLPVPPSPNLPNSHAVALYPSLCFFEATPVSVGRGTDAPFEIIGAPWFNANTFSFTPHSNTGAAHPKFEGKVCYGLDLRNESYFPGNGIHLNYLCDAYQTYKLKGMESEAPFFNSFMDKLAGGPELEKAILRGDSPEAIQETWQPALRSYQEVRWKYLLYSEN